MFPFIFKHFQRTTASRKSFYSIAFIMNSFTFLLSLEKNSFSCFIFCFYLQISALLAECFSFINSDRWHFKASRTRFSREALEKRLFSGCLPSLILLRFIIDQTQSSSPRKLHKNLFDDVKNTHEKLISARTFQCDNKFETELTGIVKEKTER